MYHSTRNKEIKISASQAILKGLADDGGLYVPDYIPKLDLSDSKYINMNYKELAKHILGLFLNDFSKEDINECVEKAYTGTFDNDDMAKIEKVGDKFFLELYHGKTHAFKDLALSILPHLIKKSKQIAGEKNDILILTATSGDTGKAALAAFAGESGTKIAVFYPAGGVSAMQEWQMITQKGDNLAVYAVEGNFDEAQSAVKKAFSSPELRKQLADRGYAPSSANSINIGRLIPQIVYYVYAYLELVRRAEIKLGDSINVCVPTGNFGNILAAYYAKLMGLPFGKLVCASNKNRVLTDFFHSMGTYNINRKFHLSSSPSMDILISSNFERFLYHASGENSKEIKNYMKKLKENGTYDVNIKTMAHMDGFEADYSNEKQCRLAIANLLNEHKYLIDPHTAVATYAYQKYKNRKIDNKKVLIVSTASAYKFPETVLRAIRESQKSNSSSSADYDDGKKIKNHIKPHSNYNVNPADENRIKSNITKEFELLKDLEDKTKISIPLNLKDSENDEIRFRNKIKIGEIENEILEFCDFSI